MARLGTSFARVITLFLVALHLLVLPALYFGVGYVIRKSQEDQFIQNARTFARVLADEFEVGTGLDSAARTSDLLDLAIIHGEARVAEILADRKTIVRSALGNPEMKVPPRPNIGFSDRGENTYFIVLPVLHGGRNFELRLGFDERPTIERIELALNRMLMLLAIYACVTIGIGIYLAGKLSLPIRRLQRIARRISSGDYVQSFRLVTRIVELREMALELDAMRHELVSVNGRLQEQISEKELVEGRRDSLEQQLRHRQRLETVGILAGGIAHEFNNVLLPIMLFTETALRDLPPESASHTDMERVITCARRAKTVVQKILTFSRGIDNAKLGPIDIRAAVAEALTLFRALAPAGIEIRADIADNVPLVNANSTLAQDLIMNLCTNALQSMSTTSGILTIALRTIERGNSAAAHEQWVELSVRDTGHGMDAATIERIFEPFFTTRPVGEGTGLGLAVVHGIVKGFRGTIGVESSPGEGSTFRVLIPAL